MVKTNVTKIYNAINAEAVLTEREDFRKYLTGLSTDFGYVIIDKNGSTFYTDTRYLEAAHTLLDGSDIEVKLFKGNLKELLKNYKQVAVSLSSITYAHYKKLTEIGLELVDSGKVFEEAMSIKQDYEIENISKACKITDRAFSALLPRIKEGMSENEVAAELEYLLRKFGASGTSFSTIVCFGKNSSVPHHETAHDKLKFGDVVLIDFGCKINGYCSDCTRTFLFGDDGKHDDFKKAYERVLTAHMLVKEKVIAGYTGRQADAVARDYLKEYGLDKYFTHTLGHGIGINIHEFPTLSVESDMMRDY